MKFMHLLLIVALALPLGAVSAASPAEEESGGSYAYVPLTSGEDMSTLAPEVLARQHFESLLPTLYRAQSQGLISGFEPDFAGGLVAIQYTGAQTESLSTALGGLKLYTDINLAAAMTAHPLPGKPLNPDSSSLIFNLYPGSSCFYVGSERGVKLEGTVQDPGDRVVGFLSIDTTRRYFWTWTCFNGAPRGTIYPGYKVTFKYISRGTNTDWKTYTSIVPALEYTGFDKVHGKATGKGPAGKEIGVTLSHPNLDAGNTGKSYTDNVHVTAAGSWTANFAALARLPSSGAEAPARGSASIIRGGDYSYIWFWQGTTGYRRSLSVPYSACGLGQNWCGLYGFPGKSATLNILHSGTNYKFTGRFDYGGWFGRSLVNAGGLPIGLKAGDKATGTGVSPLTLPNITVVPIPSTDKVTGKAPPNRWFWVAYIRPNGGGGSWWYSWAGSNGAGNYSANFSNPGIDRPAGGYLFYVDPVTGNYTSAYGAIGP